MNAAASQAWAPYCGAAPVPEDLLSRWNFDPVLLLALGIGAWLVWRAGRGSPRRQLGAAALGVALVLFVSPFCALSSALFSARVTHHVVLTAVLAPLLVYALPEPRARWSRSLPLWTGLQAIVFWLWHAPTLYAEALSSDAVYWVMQASLLATAMGFWAALRRSSGPAAVGGLLVSTVQMGLLGALITFAGAPLYAPHLFATTPWGWSALEDQQLAGLIMWIPMGSLYLAAALIVLARLLTRLERGGRV